MPDRQRTSAIRTGDGPSLTGPDHGRIRLDWATVKVDYAFIAESADAQNGLFYVIRGGTDIYKTPPDMPYPIGIGPMSFVVRLVGDLNEVGESRPLAFTIVDADGRPIGVEGSGEISFAEHPIDRTRSGAALIHFRLAFPVPTPGAYFFQLISDSTRIGEIPFWVMPAGPDEDGPV